MRKAILMTTLAAASMLAASASASLAQDGRSARRSSGGASGQASAAPLPDDPVRRTWDFTRRFGIINLGGRGGCGVEAEQARASIDAANRLLADFLAGPRDPKKLGLERRKYLAQVTGAQRSIGAYQEAFHSAGKRGPDGFVPSVEQDVCMAKGQRMSMLALRDGLTGIARLYPDMGEVRPVLANAEAALRSMGDDAAIAVAVNRNRGETLSSVRLKPALSNNPEWIAGFRNAFPSLIQGQTILKIHPYSANWFIHKNEVTSYPEYRQIGAWVAARKADGTCWIHSIDLWQNYTGSGYERGEYRPGGAPQQVLCENI